MPPALAASFIGTACGFGKIATELRPVGANYAEWQISETIREVTQPRRPELNRKAEPVLRATKALNNGTIGRVEMEVTRQRVGNPVRFQSICKSQVDGACQASADAVEAARGASAAPNPDTDLGRHISAALRALVSGLANDNDIARQTEVV